MKTSISLSAAKTFTLPSNDTSWSRRQFLRRVAGVGLAIPWLGRLALGAPKLVSANGKLNHACIGVGGMGWNDLQNFLHHKQVELVALCDVDANNLDKAAKAAPRARCYTDWRELLEKEADHIDLVNVAVPDHMHFAIAYTAIQRGRHVYCQKPLCHDVAEVRALTQASIRKEVVSQLGTQMASSIHERTAVGWLKEGRIGKIEHAYLCSNRPGAVQDYRLAGPRPQHGQEPPKQLNWDLWLGTAPVRPYAPDIYHPTKWRAWQDFGTGWSGDIGCHVFDAVWKGLRLQAPTTVVAEVQDSWQHSDTRRADNWPQGDHITWTFPANENTQKPELALEWFDGDYYPPEKIRQLFSSDLKEYPAESSMLIGTEGALLIPLGYPPQLLPEEKFKDVKRSTLEPRNHYHHFVDAILAGTQTESHFSQTGPMTEAILLGTVAIRMAGQKLEWSALDMKFKNEPQANRLLQRGYRQGWHAGPF